MVENLKKMQELKAQIQAQIKLAETLKKISDNAGFSLYKLFTYKYYVNLTFHRDQKPGPWSEHC